MLSKVNAVAVSALLLNAFLLTGCGSGTTPPAPEAKAPASPQGHVLKAPKVEKAPVVDGSAEAAWESIPALELTAKHEQEKTGVTLKACHDGTHFYLLATWSDPDNSSEHRPWVWDDAQGKYVAGKEREDRIAFEIAMSDTFDACMLGGTPYIADCWHWKACRSNPAGAADEEWHKVALEPFEFEGKKAPEYKDESKKRPALYMMRMKDKGKSASKSVSAPTSKGDAKLASVEAQQPDGGQADVKAKGVWKDGRWTVEFSRALKAVNTAEDADLQAGGSYPFAVAVFDKVGDDKHHTTPRGTLELGK